MTTSLEQTTSASYVGCFPEEFLKEIPKTDIHVHLDGSLRISTLIELAKQHNVALPYYTEAELREHVFRDSYASLEEYLEGFKYTCAVMQTPEALERVSYEFAYDVYSENCFFFEVRFAPQLHAGPDLDIAGVLRSVNKGLQRAKDEFNAKPDVQSGLHPHYDYGIIVSAIRFFTSESSRYYASFIEVHKYEAPERLYGLASMALVTAAQDMREKEGLPIVALDIAGAERGFPASQHEDAFAFAHKRFLHKTVHAGEGYGPESIFQAITDLHAERIGHGFHIFSPGFVYKKDNPEKFAAELCQYVADLRITLEVCLTSNLQTMPDLRLQDHAFKDMLAQRLSVSLCTDNRLVSNTSVTKELKLAISTFQLTPKQLKDIILAGFKRSFYPGPYIKKREYNRQVINYYEAIEKKYGITSESNPSTTTTSSTTTSTHK